MSNFTKSLLFVCLPLSLVVAFVDRIFGLGMYPWMHCALSVSAGYTGLQIFGRKNS